MLLITEVKDCHDGNVEELSRKLEALTQEIQTLKQKAETSAGDKPTEYPDLFELVKEYNRLASYEYRGEDKPRTDRDFLARYPKGTATHLFHQVMNEFFLKLKVREEDVNMLDLISHALYIFVQDGYQNSDRRFSEVYSMGNMNVDLFFGEIKQINHSSRDANHVAFTFVSFLARWANPGIDTDMGSLVHDYANDDTSNPFLDGKSVGRSDFGEKWEYVKKGLIILNVILWLYHIEDPIGATLVRYHRYFKKRDIPFIR